MRNLLLRCVQLAGILWLSNAYLLAPFVSQARSSSLRLRIKQTDAEEAPRHFMPKLSIPQISSVDCKRAFKNTVGGLLLAYTAMPWMPFPASAADIALPECSESVVVVRDDEHDRQVVLIGTAHISENSADMVRKTIKGVHPDVVMIELDPKRVGKVTKDQSLEKLGFMLPVGVSELSASYSSVAPQPTQNPVKQVLGALVSPIVSSVQKAAGLVLGKALSQFYTSVEKLGFNAGGEFQAAVEEARRENAKVLLGDRDVDVTLQRLATALAGADPANFDKLGEDISDVDQELGLSLSDPSSTLDKEKISAFVEGLKKKELVGRIMGRLREELPDVYNALIGERDVFMAKAIAGADSHLMVAVVGFAHLAGIENWLTTQEGFDTVARNCPPTPSR
eukprot:scaffold428_cov168-Ochromonas_danica.AAC.30